MAMSRQLLAEADRNRLAADSVRALYELLVDRDATDLNVTSNQGVTDTLWDIKASIDCLWEWMVDDTDPPPAWVNPLGKVFFLLAKSRRLSVKSAWPVTYEADYDTIAGVGSVIDVEECVVEATITLFGGSDGRDVRRPGLFDCYHRIKTLADICWILEQEKTLPRDYTIPGEDTEEHQGLARVVLADLLKTRPTEAEVTAALSDLPMRQEEDEPRPDTPPAQERKKKKKKKKNEEKERETTKSANERPDLPPSPAKRRKVTRLSPSPPPVRSPSPQRAASPDDMTTGRSYVQEDFDFDVPSPSISPEPADIPEETQVLDVRQSQDRRSAAIAAARQLLAQPFLKRTPSDDMAELVEALKVAESLAKGVDGADALVKLCRTAYQETRGLENTLHKRPLRIATSGPNNSGKSLLLNDIAKGWAHAKSGNFKVNLKGDERLFYFSFPVKSSALGNIDQTVALTKIRLDPTVPASKCIVTVAMHSREEYDLIAAAYLRLSGVAPPAFSEVRLSSEQNALLAKFGQPRHYSVDKVPGIVDEINNNFFKEDGPHILAYFVSIAANFPGLEEYDAELWDTPGIASQSQFRLALSRHCFSSVDLVFQTTQAREFEANEAERLVAHLKESVIPPQVVLTYNTHVLLMDGLTVEEVLEEVDSDNDLGQKVKVEKLITKIREEDREFVSCFDYWIYFSAIDTAEYINRRIRKHVDESLYSPIHVLHRAREAMLPRRIERVRGLVISTLAALRRGKPNIQVAKIVADIIPTPPGGNEVFLSRDSHPALRVLIPRRKGGPEPAVLTSKDGKRVEKYVFKMDAVEERTAGLPEFSRAFDATRVASGMPGTRFFSLAVNENDAVLNLPQSSSSSNPNPRTAVYVICPGPLSPGLQAYLPLRERGKYTFILVTQEAVDRSILDEFSFVLQVSAPRGDIAFLSACAILVHQKIYTRNALGLPAVNDSALRSPSFVLWQGTADSVRMFHPRLMSARDCDGDMMLDHLKHTLDQAVGAARPPRYISERDGQQDQPLPNISFMRGDEMVRFLGFANSEAFTAAARGNTTKAVAAAGELWSLLNNNMPRSVEHFRALAYAPEPQDAHVLYEVQDRYPSKEDLKKELMKRLTTDEIPERYQRVRAVKTTVDKSEIRGMARECYHQLFEHVPAAAAVSAPLRRVLDDLANYEELVKHNQVARDATYRNLPEAVVLPPEVSVAAFDARSIFLTNLLTSEEFFSRDGGSDRTIGTYLRYLASDPKLKKRVYEVTKFHAGPSPVRDEEGEAAEPPPQLVPLVQEEEEGNETPLLKPPRNKKSARPTSSVPTAPSSGSTSVSQRGRHRKSVLKEPSPPGEWKPEIVSRVVTTEERIAASRLGFTLIKENDYESYDAMHHRSKNRLKCEHAHPCECDADHDCLDDSCLNDRFECIECDETCPCGPTCRNRALYIGREAQTEVFDTATMGRGLRATERIPEGAFIMEYIGEVIGQRTYDERKMADIAELEKLREAQRKLPKKDRKRVDVPSYLMDISVTEDDLDPSELAEYASKKKKVEVSEAYIDAKFKGNYSRFINHDAENPNCEATRWQAKSAVNGWRRNRVALHAIRDIEPGEELFFDYGKTFFNDSEPGAPAKPRKRPSKDEHMGDPEAV